MKRLGLSMASIVLLAFTVAPARGAQDVPPAAKKEIVAYLKSQQDCKGEYVQFEVNGVKLGPGRTGFIGSCSYGGGIKVVYEKAPRGLVRLLQVSVPMNFDMFVSDTQHKGYYDLIVQGGSGGELKVENYRWNGRRYVRR